MVLLVSMGLVDRVVIRARGTRWCAATGKFCSWGDVVVGRGWLVVWTALSFRVDRNLLFGSAFLFVVFLVRPL